MFGTYFYHKTIRNLVVAFGSMFNNISISRTDKNDVEVERVKVPLSYSNKEKFLRRIREDAKLDQSVAVQLPRMGFEFTSISYDASRKRNTSLKRTVEDDTAAGKLKSMYTEVPYNMNFTLYIATKHVDDGLQVVEQILPYFTPEFVVTLKLENELAQKIDVPIILTSATSEYDYEGSFEDTRTLTWTLDFSVKANLYSPVKTSGIILDSAVIFKDMEAHLKDLDRPLGALSRTVASVTGSARTTGGASGPNDYAIDTQLHTVTGSGSPISGPDINSDGDGIGLDWI